MGTGEGQGTGTGTGRVVPRAAGSAGAELGHSTSCCGCSWPKKPPAQEAPSTWKRLGLVGDPTAEPTGPGEHPEHRPRGQHPRVAVKPLGMSLPEVILVLPRLCLSLLPCPRPWQRQPRPPWTLYGECGVEGHQGCPRSVPTCICSCLLLSSRVSSAPEQPRIFLILDRRTRSCNPRHPHRVLSPPPCPSWGCHLGHSFTARRARAATQMTAVSSPATTVTARRWVRAAGRGDMWQCPLTLGQCPPSTGAVVWGTLCGGVTSPCPLSP